MIQALRERSLLRDLAPGGGGDRRYALYLSIRDFAAARLDDLGLAEAARALHARALRPRGAPEHLSSVWRSEAALARLRSELPDLRAAAAWAIGAGEGDLAAHAVSAVAAHAQYFGPFAPAAALVGEALDRCALAAPARMRLAFYQASLLRRMGRGDEALAAAEAAHALALEGGEARARGSTLMLLGCVRLDRGDPAAEGLFAEAADALRASGDLGGAGTALGNLGALLWRGVRLGEATARFEEALAIHRSLGDRLMEATTLGNLANVADDLGRADEARARYEEALAIHRGLDNRDGEALTLTNLGMHHRARGDAEAARACLAEALAIGEALGDAQVIRASREGLRAL